MIEDNSKQHTTFMPPYGASSPPTYESVAYAYDDDEPLWSERDKKTRRENPDATANSTPKRFSLGTASTSSQPRELNTIAILPPRYDTSETAVPIYHYTDPITGEVVPSLLPPDYPEIQCLQSGGHIERTRFGPVGIAAAILWFPFGVAAMWRDRTVSCSRCHRILKDGRMWRGKNGRCGEQRAIARARLATEEGKPEESGRTRRQKGSCRNRRRERHGRCGRRYEY